MLAAREDQVTGENAARIQARLIAEGANGPTSLEADAILAERGIPVLPDVLTNAGGVTVSYFEWVQDLGRLFWDRDEIRAKLADKLGDAFDRVWTLAAERDITLRSAALVAGIREVAGALERPGDLPVSDKVRDAMVPEPLTLEASATAQEAGEHLTQPDVRAVFVSRRRPLRRRDHAQDARPRGGRGRARPGHDEVGEIAEPAHWTLDSEMPLDEAFRFLEEHDAERVPVVEDGRLVGVLSRSVLQPPPGRGRAAGRDAARHGCVESSSRCRRPAARRPLRARAAPRPRARRRAAGRAR